MIQGISSYFKIKEYNTTFYREVFSGLSLFFIVSYILIANSTILSAAGLDKHALFIATAIVAGLASIAMGLYANLPIVIAPGMGTNAWFAYGIVLAAGYSAPQALAAVFLSGLLILIVSLLGLRKYVLQIITPNIRVGITSGIGLFLIMLGMQIGGIIQPSEATMISIGDISSISFIATAVGLIFLLIMNNFKASWSIFLVLTLLTILSLITGETSVSGNMNSSFDISSIFMIIDFSSIFSLSFYAVVISLFLTGFLDSSGSILSLMDLIKSKSNDEKESEGSHEPTSDSDSRLKRGLVVDGLFTMFGACFGTSNVTAYTESGTSVIMGGRTGIVSIVVGLMFLISIFMSPIVHIIPSWATAPIIIYVGMMIFSSIRNIDWDRKSDLMPALLAVIIMPLTFSVVHGIGAALLSYLLINLFNKRVEISVKCVLTVVSVLYIIFLVTSLL